jgi:hypothetical protein
MKKLLLLSVFLLVAAVSPMMLGAAFADYSGVIDSFTAHTDGDVISVDWKTGVETGVRSYVIERSDVGTSAFSPMGTMTASGNYSNYHFKDVHVSGAQASGQASPKTPASDLYKYRIQITYDNAVSYSSTIFVTRPSSGVRRTWGMIKEMFH